jgi:hypothetical protein
MNSGNKPKGETKEVVQFPNNEKPTPTSKTFNTAFKTMKMMVFFFGVVMVIVVISAYLMVDQSYQISQQRAFFVSEMGTFVGSAEEQRLIDEIEVENHAVLFLKNMYGFDERSYERNIERALHLIGNDGKLILQGYQDDDVQGALVKNNATVSVVIDSVWTKVDKRPFRARVFAKQVFETPAGIQRNFLVADMELKRVARHKENNKYGLLIDEFGIINNSPVPKE